MKFKMPSRNGKNVFLSAAMPDPKSPFYETADPNLISMAARELAITLIMNGFHIVSEESPSLDPMIDAICESLGVHPSEIATRYKEGTQPEIMLSKEKLAGAAFIAGDGRIFDEFGLFKGKYPETPAIALVSTGGAAREIAKKLNPDAKNDLNFTKIFHRFLADIPSQEEQKTCPL